MRVISAALAVVALLICLGNSVKVRVDELLAPYHREEVLKLSQPINRRLGGSYWSAGALLSVTSNSKMR